ncbi:hypothetical protein MLD38_013199 [Melastoma candidum]|uniref:Uncharacterized protein n=1 Tax=Melastoma candidum TaxID=119954 RepID=A0ACB9R8V4_9MYRT|nr:hypothetical protein MLD38_013199 [Melastoma candidum]
MSRELIACSQASGNRPYLGRAIEGRSHGGVPSFSYLIKNIKLRHPGKKLPCIPRFFFVQSDEIDNGGSFSPGESLAVCRRDSAIYVSPVGVSEVQGHLSSFRELNLLPLTNACTR